MSKLVKLIKRDGSHCYVNPALVTRVDKEFDCTQVTIYFDYNNSIRVGEPWSDVVAKLNVDTEKVEQPEQLNVNNVLIYNGRIYQAVKDKICSACAFYEKGKACDDNRGRCTDQQIHFRKVTQHE